MAGQTSLASLPNKCFLTEIQQLDSFIRKTHRGCKRKGCRGKIIPVEVVTKNPGGAVKIVHHRQPPTKKPFHGHTGGVHNCWVHSSYIQESILGISPVSYEEDAPCSRGNSDRDVRLRKGENKDQTKLSSCSKAVTCADGWSTAVLHSSVPKWPWQDRHQQALQRNIKVHGRLWCKHNW